ncbi:MAG: ATP synthase F1 subunit gamma [Lachnospiraceae bacterium]|nr:ATP synthase F1 subunit gamma [Lachnospiraceae bacterium]MBO5097269.1 ATP synthase F1 subunit gamma [Agathobacter sp.]
MASMRDIKRRKNSVTSTQQITKAMKLVSTVKLQKARTRAEKTNPYTEQMYKTVSSMMRKSGNIIHPYLTAGESERKAVIVITSNRGLAGGYNSNVVKLITNGEFKKEDLDIYALGSKGHDMLARRGYHIAENRSDIMDDPTYTDASNLCRRVLDSFAKGEVGEIYLAYTHFKNTVTHIPTLVKLLPVDTTGMEEVEEDNVMMNFEPTTEEALDMIIPKYVTSLFYGALVEAVASENGARMQAMDSATSNADEIISDLTLKFNRARQGAITQELTEIIAGANAIN